MQNFKSKKKCTFLVFCMLFGMVGCGEQTVIDTTSNPNNQSNWQWNIPAYAPQPRVPVDNPMTVDKVELGRFLFYDKRLSADNSKSCSSCHMQSKAFSDGKVTPTGITGQVLLRNSQSLANVVYLPTLTWANPSLVSLESQMQVPLFGDDPIEMGINDSNKNEVLARITQDVRYQKLFATAYPTDPNPITYNRIVQAIASFQRSLVSFDSKYDQVLTGKATFSAAEKRGFELFNGEKAECFHCHGSFIFNDQVVHASTRVLETPFHNTGLYNLDPVTGAYPYLNRGVFELSERPADMGAFRVPSLRNVALTAPYFHDGSGASLEAVLQAYAAGGRNITEGPNKGDGRANIHKDPLIVSIDLSEADQADIIAFLRTLTDETFINNQSLSNPFK